MAAYPRTSVPAPDHAPVAGVYLLHFDPPYKHARHYCGWASDIRARVLEHVRCSGKSSPLVVAAIGAGCRVSVTRVWPTETRQKERRLKVSGGASRYCPKCLAAERADRSSDDVRLNVPLARVLLERAQDGYVNPIGGKTTGRGRKES